MRSSPLRPLRHRAVRLIWGASVVSDIGTWVQLIVIGSLVARESGSAFQTGLVALATFVPQGITAPIGGLLADRMDRRKLFIFGLLGQGLSTGVLALTLGLGVRSPGPLIVVILFASCFGSFGQPAYSAMVPDLVPPEELMQMVSLGILSWNAGRVIGPVTGAILVAIAGPAWSITFNAITFVLLAGAVGMVRRKFPPDPGADGGSVRSRLQVGWRALRSTPGCWHGWYVIALINLAIAPFMGLIPIYSAKVFRGGAGLTGLFSTMQGFGAITGTVLATTTAARYGPAKVLGIAAPAAVVVYAAWSVAPSPAYGVVAVIGLGACVAMLFVTGMSILQRDAPAEQRGRVMSIAQASMGMSYGLGLIWVGALADATNLRLALGAAAALFGLGFVYLLNRSLNWRRAVDGLPISLAAG